MASQVKGISIDISADTSKFQKALKGLDAPIQKINSELKDLNYALKLDPKNTQLLAQKHEVLTRKIAESKDKLEALKQAQKEMGEYSSLTDEQKAKYNQLSVEIAKTESSIKDMNKELRASSEINMEKLKNGLKKVGDVALEVTKTLGKVSMAVGGALAGLVTAGVKSYAEFEQVNEGAKLLFGEGYDYIADKSKEAATTMGMSANQYLQQVNGLAVGLKTALGGNEKAAAELANKVLTAEADIVAATGNTQENVQNAFNGIMKGNYSMLDNLQLGITPTKKGMEEVIQKVNEWNKAQGNATKYQMGNYADMQAALVDYVKMQGIAGYAANEAADTISGSANAMKAAFDNFINGSGSPKVLAEAFSNFAINIGTAFADLLPNIVSGLTTLFSKIAPLLTDMLWELLPQLLSEISNLLTAIFSFITNNQQQIAETITMVINEIIMFITQNLPSLIQAGISILLALVDGIVGAIPTLAEALPQLITTILDVLITNIPAVLNGAIQLFMALVEAIPVIVQALVDNLPTIIDTIITTLIDNIPMLLQGAIQLFMAIVKAVPQVIIQLVKITPTIITSVVKSLWNNRGKILESGKQILLSLKDGIINNLSTLMNKVKEIPTKLKEWLISGITKIKDAGKDLINGLWDGIQEKWENLKDKVKDFGKGVVGKFKKVFGIKSPSKVFKEEIGQWLGYGIEEGFIDTMDQVSKNMANSIPVESLVSQVNGAMSSLTHGINGSINPNINPNITYDMNYQMMANAMKDAMSDMEIALDDREVGKFVTKTITDEIYGGNV